MRVWPSGVATMPFPREKEPDASWSSAKSPDSGSGVAASVPAGSLPFLEPFLPYYDSIRNEAAFVALLAEIQRQ